MKVFKDFPQFTPNVSPKDVLREGSFGGTYFRPIKSSVTGNTYTSQEVINEYPKYWFQGINIDKMVTSSTYDKKVNKYNVKCGSSLENWEENGWIDKQDPYGWFQWYCRFYQGRRTNDDERQIKRWEKLAGPNGRFRRRLMNLIIQKEKKYNDLTISPVIRQVLLHWGYELTSKDLSDYKRSLKK
tara:strand:- start:5833 stop:6387 length:555 start_codon:yes stop_codon:yes gene_type:complete